MKKEEEKMLRKMKKVMVMVKGDKEFSVGSSEIY